ncbi:hypothetical protein [Flavobacterium faecale]|uniref:hypothetical protein n=1 Tax=Flavobacterium faecale TaxID=1355330 RepID=UPI003AAC5D31
MKNIIYTFKIIMFSMLLIACENDGGDSKIAIDRAAIPNIQKTATSDSFINLVDLNNNQPINLELSVAVAYGDISSMDIVGFYTQGNTTYKSILKANQTTFPLTLSFTAQDIISAFSVLNTKEDFKIGDKLIISANVTLKNGKVYKIYDDNGEPNFGSDVSNSVQYSVGQTFLVSCPSFLAGTYSYSTTNIGDGVFFTTDNYTGSVTFTDKSGGIYEISDGTFGGYDYLYGETATGVQLQDICNKISFKGTNQYGDSFTMTNLVVNGNKLSFHWETSYGEFGDTTLTRTDNTNWPDLTL